MDNNKKNSNIIAIVGFILSFFIGIAGLICSIIGLRKSKELNDGKGFSIAGIIISSLRIITTIFVFILGILIVVSESKDIIHDTKKDIDRIIEEDKNKACNKTNTIKVFANNKNNIITFEYTFEPYEYENQMNEGFTSNTYVKVKINDNYVEDFKVIYKYHTENDCEIDYLTKDNVSVLTGKDKDYFVLSIPEANPYVGSRRNLRVLNEKGNILYTIEYPSNSEMKVTDTKSIMYDKGTYYIDSDKLYFIKPYCGAGFNKFKEYMLIIDNDVVTLEEGNIVDGISTEEIVCLETN